MGGMNYFSGQKTSRGYYLSVGPYEIGNGMLSFMAFSGACHCIEEASRFGQNKLECLAANIETVHSELVQRLTKHVMEKQLRENA